MAHRTVGRSPSRLDLAQAKAVATTLQALATPSRLLILGRLREGSATVGELAEAVEMEQSAVSTSCACCATSVCRRAQAGPQHRLLALR